METGLNYGNSPFGEGCGPVPVSLMDLSFDIEDLRNAIAESGLSGSAVGPTEQLRLAAQAHALVAISIAAIEDAAFQRCLADMPAPANQAELNYLFAYAKYAAETLIEAMQSTDVAISVPLRLRLAQARELAAAAMHPAL